MSSYLNFNKQIKSDQVSSLKKGTINIYAKKSQRTHSKTNVTTYFHTISGYQFVNFPGISSDKQSTTNLLFDSPVCSDNVCSFYPVLISAIGKDFSNNSYTYISNLSTTGVYLSFATNKISVKLGNLSDIGMQGVSDNSDEQIVGQINVLYEDNNNYIHTAPEYYQYTKHIGIF